MRLTILSTLLFFFVSIGHIMAQSDAGILTLNPYKLVNGSATAQPLELPEEFTTDIARSYAGNLMAAAHLANPAEAANYERAEQLLVPYLMDLHDYQYDKSESPEERRTMLEAFENKGNTLRQELVELIGVAEIGRLRTYGIFPRTR